MQGEHGDGFRGCGYYGGMCGEVSEELVLQCALCFQKNFKSLTESTMQCSVS